MLFDSKYKINLVKQLYGFDYLTVSQLSKKIRKSIPFTTALIHEMVNEGVLEESGFANSNGGRRPQMYSFKGDRYVLLSVAVNQISTRIALFNLKGQMVGGIYEREIYLNRTGDDLIELGSFIKSVVCRLDLSEKCILGVGIGMPGFINVNEGKNHSFLLHGHKSITQYLEDKLKFPVFIDNDSSLLALAELRSGLASKYQNVLVINMGWGIGLGAIVSGTVLRGENGYAGEFSHIAIYKNEKLCSCGKMGCLETETSMHVLVERAKKGIENGVFTSLPSNMSTNKTEALEQVFDGVRRGDTFALSLVKYVGNNLGRGISILIHLFNPSLIILSGTGAKIGKVWLAPVQQTINELSIPKLAENIELEMSELGFNADLIGPAALVVENLDVVATNYVKERLFEI